jgi:hypothetical protein
VDFIEYFITFLLIKKIKYYLITTRRKTALLKKGYLMKKLYFCAVILSLAFSVSAQAGTTTVDLYRGGNATNARMDNVRTGPPAHTVSDVQTVTEGGVVYVLPGNGGLSTNALLSNVSAPAWKLPKGSVYPDTLVLVDDKSNNHWSWRPATKMTLDSFKSILAIFNSKFTKMP